MSKPSPTAVQIAAFLIIGGWIAFLIESPLYFDRPALRWVAPGAAALIALSLGRRDRRTRVLWIIGAVAALWIESAVRPLADYKRESVMAGNLGLLRLELEEFRKREGRPPLDLSPLRRDPDALTLRLYPDHPKSNEVLIVESAEAARAVATDTGTWLYRRDEGVLTINCSHRRRHGGGAAWREL